MNSKPSLFRRCRVFLYLLPLLGVSFAHSQDTPQGEADRYRFRFSVAALTPDRVEVTSLTEAVDLGVSNVFYETGGVVREIKRIPFQARSDSYLYQGDGALTLFRPASSEKGEPMVLARVEPAREWRSVLLLALPREQGGDAGFDVDIIQDDSRSFPAESLCIVNRSAVAITVDIDSESRDVAAGAQSIIPSKLQKARMLPIRLFVPEGGGKKEIYSTSVPYRPGQRILLLLRKGVTGQVAPRVPPVVIVDAPARTKYDPFDPAKAGRNP